MGPPFIKDWRQKMNSLKKGTLCIIIGGCPENIGSIVEIVKHLGKHGDRDDAYLIKTISGRNFNQLWINGLLTKGNAIEAVTDRHKLKPLPGCNMQEVIYKTEQKKVLEKIN